MDSFVIKMMEKLQAARRSVIIRPSKLDKDMGKQGNMHPVTRTKLRSLIVFGMNQIPAEAKATIQFIVVETIDDYKRDFKKIYFVGTTRPGNTTPELFRQSLFVLATMSQNIGVSGGLHDFYYHPPSVAGKLFVTSHSSRVQALNTERAAGIQARSEDQTERSRVATMAHGL